MRLSAGCKSWNKWEPEVDEKKAAKLVDKLEQGEWFLDDRTDPAKEVIEMRRFSISVARVPRQTRGGSMMVTHATGGCGQVFNGSDVVENRKPSRDTFGRGNAALPSRAIELALAHVFAGGIGFSSTDMNDALRSTL